MQTRRIYPFLPLFLLAFLPNFLHAQPENEHEWKLKRDKGGIQVYMREQSGTDSKEMKFTTEIEASLNAVAAILTDVAGFDDWVYASMESYTIEEISDTEVIYYTSLDFPWPMSNRDLVLHSIFWQDEKTLAIHSATTSVHDLMDEKEDFIRITKADLYWTFTPLGNGMVRVDYQLNSDPGGHIPAWMINLAADQGPLQTMIKFKEEIAKEKYRNAKLAFVQEFE